jgi:hypothetical protein
VFAVTPADPDSPESRALRPLADGVAELKRMYARPGSGAGRFVLAALERQALAFGYTEAWLEMRRVNGRAVGFYEKHGYLVIPNYGKYAGKPEAVCLGKHLVGWAPRARPTYVRLFL